MSDEKRFVYTRFFFGTYELLVSTVYNGHLQYGCHVNTRLWHGLTTLCSCIYEELWIPHQCICWFIIFGSWHDVHHLLFNMSKHNRSTKPGANAVVCYNPFCTRQRKAFTNNAAFQKHLAVMPQCRIFLETHNQHEYHVHTARAPSLPQTMARNVIDVSNSLNA